MAKDNKDTPKNQPHDNDAPSSSGIANKPDKSTTETQAIEQSITQGQKKIVTNRPGEKWVIGLTLAFDVLLIIVTGVYTYYSSQQWQAMRKALEETRISREIENRAYLSIKLAEMKTAIQAGQQVIVWVHFENTGRTPAVNGYVSTGIAIRDSPLAEADFTLPAPISRAVLPPNTTFRTVFTKEISADEVNAISQSRAKLYVYGIAEYDDIFGKHRRTKFCLENDASTGTQFQACPQYNSFE